jgi:hypothetical protein
MSCRLFSGLTRRIDYHVVASIGRRRLQQENKNEALRPVVLICCKRGFHTSSSSSLLPSTTLSSLSWSNTSNIQQEHQQQQQHQRQRKQFRVFSSDSSSSPKQNQNDDRKEENKQGTTGTKSNQNASTTNEDLVMAHWMEQLTSIPNQITLTRIASAPVLAYWIINHQTNYALIGCFVAGLSDVADGYLARNYDMATTLGTFLDPLGT